MAFCDDGDSCLALAKNQIYTNIAEETTNGKNEKMKETDEKLQKNQFHSRCGKHFSVHIDV